MLSFRHGQSIKSDTDVHYRYLQILGTGKNATTILVTPSSGERRGLLFALKIFERLDSDESKRRFFKEVAFLQTCTHPAIMRVYDSGSFETVTGTRPFVVAEYFPQTLRDLVGRDDVSIPQRLSFALQLLSALEFLAACRPAVVHRDIKPDNIFIKGKACVLGDFGLMKRVMPNSRSDPADVLRESMGAVMPRSYRTPDLIQYVQGRRDIDTASDVFQLGLTLAELFTGCNPAYADRDNPDDLILETVGHISGEIGGLIFTTIRDMLEFDPARRPSASQVFDRWQTAFFSATELSFRLNERSL